MEIDFYTNFYKKDNSTKQPTVGGYGNLTEKHTVTGYLREPCSVLHPQVSLQGTPVTSTIPAVCTYAYIPHFSRYYFVKDWVWNDGLWTCQMDIDVLATWKNEIGDMNEYILRTDGTSSNMDETITDTMYPATTDFSINEYSMSNVFSTTISDGCYIVGIISGGTSNAVGAISYYALTSSQFASLKSKLFSDNNLMIMGIIDSQGEELVNDISQEVLKTIYNPYQYIVSCMWFPFSATSITSKTQVSTINIGWWSYSLTGYSLYAQRIEFGESGSLPSHPQASSRGSYLNYAPYTRRSIIGRFGTVAIDTSFFKLGNYLSIGYLVDLITGQCRATIEIYDSSQQNPTHTVIAERYFMLGVPIQIAQVGTDYLGTAVSVLNSVSGTVSSAFSGALSGGLVGGITGAVAGVANGIYNTVQSAMPQVETSGSNGSFLAPAVTTKVLSQFFRIVDENIIHKGRPLCSMRTIKNLTGFILCADADVDMDCYDEERKKIGEYLVTGFFWE